MRVRGKLPVYALCAALVVATALLVSSLVASAGGAEDDKGVLAGLISRVLSSPGMQVSIGAVDGALSSDATIRNVVISDAQGPWLKVDRIRLLWTRSALLLRRLDVDRLEIGHVEFARKPLRSGPRKKESPLLPELPVKVVVRDFALDDLALGEPILGAAAHLSAKGHASLGDPAQGLDLVFDAERADAPGGFKAALSFSPESQILKIKLAGHEPSGGLLARALALSGAPSVDLDLDGEGTLDAFSAHMALTAGPDLEANGTLGLARNGSRRNLKLALAGRVGGLLPSDLLPLVGGPSRLDASLSIGDDRSVRIENATLATPAAQLEASGGVGSAGSLDVRADLRALASAANARFSARRFNVDAIATGSLAAPRLSATLDLAQVKTPAGGLESLKANLSANAQGALGGADSHLSFSGRGAAAGLSFADPRLASAVGSSLAFDLRGDLAANGTADFSVAKLTGDQAAFAFVGQAGSHMVKGRLNARVERLAAFRALLGRDIAGSLEADVGLTGVPDQESLSGAIEAEWDRPQTGAATLDRLIGAKLSIKGGLAQAGSWGFDFTNFLLSGEGASARIDGHVAKDHADLNASLDVSDLRRADPRLSGRASAVARLTGSLDDPSATAHIALTKASALGRAIPP